MGSAEAWSQRIVVPNEDQLLRRSLRAVCTVLDVQEVRAVPSVKSRLTTVYLEHTPLYELPDYRERCLAMLPSVTQLDISLQTTRRSLHPTPMPFVNNK